MPRWCASLDGLDVEGPVQAELFVVWLHGDQVELTGPCGAAPWLIEVGETDHPVEAVSRVVRDVIGEPLLVHSTSWRRDRAALILSFVVVIDAALVGSMDSVPLGRADLARGRATAAPREIGFEQVVEHGLRHMAWLAKDDPVVRDELPGAGRWPWPATSPSRSGTSDDRRNDDRRGPDRPLRLRMGDDRQRGRCR